MAINVRVFLYSIVVSLVFGTVVYTQGDKDAKKPAKLTADEIVSKHLASIGSLEDLAAAKSRVMVGDGQISTKIGASFILNGTGQIASQGDKVVYAMVFENTIYPYEKAAFNGSDVSVALPNGKKTPLANYLTAQNSMLKEGLFTGALSTAWPLLDIKNKKSVKLEYAGTSKIDDRQCYKLKYSSSKTGDLKVALYFDSETFRHVRTEYEYTIEGHIGNGPTDVRSSSRTERYHLTEDFSDFQVAGKLTLPFTYKINITNELQIVSPAGNISRDWLFTVKNVYFGEQLKDESFKVN